jgi:hypothetical protein
MSSTTWEDWPVCPSCHRRRQTACPVCGVAGDGFPLSDYLAPLEPMRDSRKPEVLSRQQQKDGLEVLLICPQCDEAFSPNFYRYCAECGHDYLEGMDVEKGDFEVLTERTLWAIVALVVVGVALLAYFSLMF